MSVLLTIGWIAWGVVAATMATQSVARVIVQERALRRVVEADATTLSAHERRILMNKGDWRDPVERHQDAMSAITQTISLVTTGGVLGFFTRVGT